MRPLHRESPLLLRAFALSCAMLAAACGGDGGGHGTGPGPDPDPDPPSVAAVVITPATPRVFEDGSLTLAVETRAADGRVLTGRAVAWSSSDPQVASVSSTGVVSASDPGTASISATSEGQTGTVTVTVLRSNTAQVEVSPGGVLLGTGDTATLSAVARDSVGRALRDRAFVWQTDAPAVATVSDGVVTGVREGVTTLRESSEGVEGTAVVDVFTATGLQVPELAAVDAEMVAYMREHGVPGGVVAVSHEGRLVHARGYGVTDLVGGEPIAPDQVLRWGSVSKPIAGLAAAVLIEAGVIAPTDLPFQSMPGLTPLPGETMAAGVADITLLDLMNHAGGWDASRAVDNRLWLDGTNRDGVRDQATLIRYGLSVPLVHPPGTTHAYTNYATQVVAEYIAARTGMAFEEWVQANLFAPLGITGPRFGTGDPALESDQPVYHDPSGDAIRVAVLDQNYAGASGAWVGRSLDLLRLFDAIDGRRGEALLGAAAMERFTARPDALFPGSGYYYTHFMEFEPRGAGLDWYHTGQPRGGLARAWHRADGTTWVMIVTRSPEAGVPYPSLNDAIDRVSTWPAHDLYPAFAHPGPAHPPPNP